MERGAVFPLHNWNRRTVLILKQVEILKKNLESYSARFNFSNTETKRDNI